MKAGLKTKVNQLPFERGLVIQRGKNRETDVETDPEKEAFKAQT